MATNPAPKPNKTLKPKSLPGTPEGDANTYIGIYLYAYGDKITEARSLNRGSRKALAHFGPRGIIAKPVVVAPGKDFVNGRYKTFGSRRFGSRRGRIDYSALDNLAPGDGRYFLQGMLGCDPGQAGTGAGDLLTNPVTMAQYVSELQPVLDAMTQGNTDKMWMNKAHPYILVMSLDAKLRSLPAIAIGRRMEEKLIEPFGYHEEHADAWIRNGALPSFREIVAVARDYNQKNVLDVMDGLQKCIQEYERVYEQGQRRSR